MVSLWARSGAEEVAGELGGGVGAAGGFEVVDGGGKRGVEFAAVGGDEGLVGAPAAGGELLGLGEEVEGVGHGEAVFGVALGEVGLAGGGERDGVGVGVLAGEGVGAAGQRVEEFAVEEVAVGEVGEGLVLGELRGEEEVLGHDEGLVVGRVLLADAVVALGGEERLGSGEDAVEEVLGLRHVAEGGGVDEAGEVLVEDVAGPEVGGGAEDGLVLRGRAWRRSLSTSSRAFCGQAGSAVEAPMRAEAGDVLAEGVAGDEAVEIVPAAHVGAGGGQAGALAVDLQEGVVGEAEVVRFEGLVLVVEGAGG